MSLMEIGCCGAYCGTCRAYGVVCKGCRIGYDTGERDIAKARCKIKLCCLSRQLETCADCPQYLVCGVLGALHAKSGYKYGKYRQALDYVRENGYEAFLVIADRWTGAYGTYPPPSGETKSRLSVRPMPRGSATQISMNDLAPDGDRLSKDDATRLDGRSR